MFSIGDFARLGLVSQRMLRHYDAIGLLPPAHVDQHTGYRYYRGEQLRVLNRIIALKDLGFTLDQVRAILDEQLGVDQLKGMLRLRRAQLAVQVEADMDRLARVEARLRTMEREGTMPADEVVVKRVEAVRVAEVTGVAAGYDSKDIGPVIQPLYPELFGKLEAAGLTPVGPAIAYYEDLDDKVLVHAAVPVSGQPVAGSGLAIVDLPGIEQAATLLHRGPMSEVGGTIEALASWTDEHGYQGGGYFREVYLEVNAPDQSDWVTELQQPITRG
ncbi:MerR family transcriptional regulator [Kutzneria albida]|uniref:MerR family transcription regulator n=1 Tax=Kutzneria albida DSM 43870 TaxID=1449976 RepID=W5W310_9PSEU|nr:MerR family transcriptional regulator [Kutzneria albida]AHH95588.1 MerR family transcription regulator [Kutzneria albida DSM 43870]